MQSFSLIPFPTTHLPEISITGNISWQNNLLALRYVVAGNTADIFLPPPSAHPSRKDELWKMTCFEFFLAIKSQPRYWEFNMSPSGDWNVYRMDTYRRVGFREETFIQQLPFSVRKEARCVSVEAAVDLGPIIQADQLIQVGIASIVQAKDGHETYWALRHPAEHADFHLRESFALELAG